jgi:hypothetical protein
MSKLSSSNVIIGTKLVRVEVYDTEKTINISYDPPLCYLDEASQEGEIITNNELHKHLISCLLKDDEELRKLSGLTIPSEYRVQLTRAISCLWD